MKEIQKYEDARDWLKSFYQDRKMTSLKTLTLQKEKLQQQIASEEEAISSLKEKLKDLDTADQNVVVILQMQISEPARCSRQIPGLLFQFRRSVLLYTFYCYFSNFSSILLLR